jgi:hypothetical protein
MNDGFTTLAVSADDPGGVRLRGALTAQFAYERARALRELLVYVLAALSIPVWIAAAWPATVTADFRRLAVTVWVLCLASVLVALGSEWRWHRRRASFIVDG